MQKIVQVTHSPAETMAFAETVGRRLRAGDIIAYTGGLGVGKTTFTRGLAKGMGLPDVVSSPTFAIVQEYHGDGLSLYHFDMYRIADVMELESTGYYDYPLEEGVFAIEWAEHMIEALPPDVIRITFVRLSDDVRQITIEGDERFADLGDGYLGQNGGSGGL